MVPDEFAHPWEIMLAAPFNKQLTHGQGPKIATASPNLPRLRKHTHQIVPEHACLKAVLRDIHKSMRAARKEAYHIMKLRDVMSR